MDRIPITTEYIRLDGLLKFAGLAQTGGHAKEIIMEGRVKVNGAVRLQRGAKVYPGDVVEYDETAITVEVSGHDD